MPSAASPASRPTPASSPPTPSSPRIDAELVHRELLGRPLRPRERSLSGLALMLGLRGRTPDLVHHAITFPADYDAEFDAVFGGRPARDPTIYVSAVVRDRPRRDAGELVRARQRAVGRRRSTGTRRRSG